MVCPVGDLVTCNPHVLNFYPHSCCYKTIEVIRIATDTTAVVMANFDCASSVRNKKYLLFEILPIMLCRSALVQWLGTHTFLLYEMVHTCIFNAMMALLIEDGLHV